MLASVENQKNGAHLRGEVGWKLEFLVEDLLLQRLAIARAEGVLARQHLVHQHPHAPPVCRHPMPFAQDDLRRLLIQTMRAY